MNSQTFFVAARINAHAFRSFAVFDNFRLRRVWRSPLLFALILSVCACICFLLQDRAEQAVLLGGILLALGLGLPIFYFLNFFLSIQKQIKKMKLDQQPKVAYTLTINKEDGVCITAGTRKTALAWSDLFGAYRVPGYIYLYAAVNRAYLLPEEQIDTDADQLWQLLTDCIPPLSPDRLRDFRR